MKTITKEEILAAIAVDYSDDKEFLEKINKITFGLIKPNNVRNFN